MEYQEVIKRLEEMKSRYEVGFSSKDRSFLESIHYTLFGKVISNKGCSDCYRDAYMLIQIKLKKDKAMPKEADYKLKAGAIIQFFGDSRVYVNATLTNAIAERYISLNPDNIAMFAKYPDDYADRVAKYVASNVKEAEDEPTSETLLKEIAELREKNASLEQSVAGLEEQLALANKKNEDLSAMDVATDNSAVIAELEKAVSDLKAENRALKAANTRLKKKEAAEDAQEEAGQVEPSDDASSTSNED